MDPRFLTVHDVFQIHRLQIETYGGSPELRDQGLLQSALAMPQATFGGEFLCGDLLGMAAAYLFHICQNHPFVDGNKRAALAAAGVFLALNGIALVADSQELENLVMDVASGAIGKPEIQSFLRRNTEVAA